MSFKLSDVVFQKIQTVNSVSHLPILQLNYLIVCLIIFWYLHKPGGRIPDRTKQAKTFQ